MTQRPKPRGVLPIHEACVEVGLSYGTYHRLLSSGQIQKVVGIPASARDIPTRLLQQHRSAIAQLGNPRMRMVRAGKLADARTAEKQARLSRAVAEAEVIMSRGGGKLTASTTQTLVRNESMLPEVARAALSQHRDLQAQDARDFTHDWYHRQADVRKKAARTEILAGAKAPADIPSWAVKALRYSDEDAQITEILQERAMELKRLSKARRREAGSTCTVPKRQSMPPSRLAKVIALQVPQAAAPTKAADSQGTDRRELIQRFFARKPKGSPLAVETDRNEIEEPRPRRKGAFHNEDYSWSDVKDFFKQDE